jgi:Mrp family chromosome partitioning ATPase
LHTHAVGEMQNRIISKSFQNVFIRSSQPCFRKSYAHDAFGIGGRNAAAAMKRGLPTKKQIQNVRHVVAVASGKGGVGKSTIAGLKIQS